ncbi:MAG: hypothetical protein IKS90_07655 [Clostridia bacterium]|nr:hypothetical protein [Clostridia bacterium]
MKGFIRIAALLLCAMLFMAAACTGAEKPISTPEPTEVHTAAPSEVPTAVPTEAQTEVPTEVPSAKPIDPQCVEAAWKYAETANREYGFSLQKDTCEAFYDGLGKRLEYIVFTNGKHWFEERSQSISVYFDYSTGTEVRRASLSGDPQADAPDASSLSEEEKQKFNETGLLGEYEVTIEDLTAAGYTLDGTDQDYIKIAEYCVNLKATELLEMPALIKYHCDDVKVGDVRFDERYKECWFTLYVRPTYPQAFTAYLAGENDMGALKAYDDPDHPGSIYFSGVVEIQKFGAVWRCKIAYPS